MTTQGSAWRRWVANSRAVAFVDACLRGAGQVMFQDHPGAGLLFLAAVAWGAHAAHAPAPPVASAAVGALVVGTAAARWLDVDAGAWSSGLFGYNALLVGIALPTFLAAATPVLAGYVVLGAIVSVVAMLALGSVVKTWSVSALTAPFVGVTWVMLLAAYALSALPVTALPAAGLPAAADPARAFALDGTGAAFAAATLRGVSQVFLQDDAIAGLLVVAGLAVASWRAALAAVAGSMLALATTFALGGADALARAGLFGFSPVLTAVAIATVFYTPGARVILYATVATVFTVVAQAALDAALRPFGIPSLTAAFVLVTWLFLLPRRRFAPVAHTTGSGGALHDR